MNPLPPATPTGTFRCPPTLPLPGLFSWLDISRLRPFPPPLLCLLSCQAGTLLATLELDDAAAAAKSAPTLSPLTFPAPQLDPDSRWVTCPEPPCSRPHPPLNADPHSSVEQEGRDSLGAKGDSLEAALPRSIPSSSGGAPGRRLKASKHLAVSLEAANSLLDGYHLDPVLVRNAPGAPHCSSHHRVAASVWPTPIWMSTTWTPCW